MIDFINFSVSCVIILILLILFLYLIKFINN
nr:MAG TPA: capsid protein [Caudoviricetes sp.]